MMSLTRQFSQAVGASHAPGLSASSNMRSASLRTTRRMVSLPSYEVASHSVTAEHPSLGDLHRHSDGAAGQARMGDLARHGGRPQYEAQRSRIALSMADSESLYTAPRRGVGVTFIS